MNNLNMHLDGDLPTSFVSVSIKQLTDAESEIPEDEIRGRSTEILAERFREWIQPQMNNPRRIAPPGAVFFQVMITALCVNILEVERQDALGAHGVIFTHACTGHEIAKIPVPGEVVVEFPLNLEINFRSEIVGRAGIAILFINLLG